MACQTDVTFDCFKRGDTLIMQNIEYKDNEGVERQPLTNYTLLCQGRTKETDEKKFDVSLGDGITIIDEDQGEWEIRVEKEVTTLFDTGDLIFDIEFLVSGVTVSSNTGVIPIIEGVTR